MATKLRGWYKSRRSLAAASLFAAFVFSASCGERAPLVPTGVAGRAAFALKPSFSALPTGAASIPLSRIEATLTSASGEVFKKEARFVNGVALLDFELPVTGTSATFEAVYVGYDMQGVVAYTAKQTLILKPGNNDHVPQPVLVYDAPDAKVTALRITPGPMTIPAGSAGSLGVSGTLPGGQNLTPRVGWTSSNSAIVAVNENGGLTAGRSQGSATITATTLGPVPVSASVLVKVQAPIDKVTVNPGAISLIRGKTAPAVVDMRDVTNVVIDDRTPVWTTSDASIATVSATGVVSGVKVGKATITATAEGKTGSAEVTVVTPVDRLEATPGSLSFKTLKTSSTVSVKVVPVAGGSVENLVPVFKTSNPAVAIVEGGGVVTAISNGSATITAELEGSTASISVSVQQEAVALTISPRAASVSSLGGSVTFSTTVVDAGSNSIDKPTVLWTSSDASVATVAGNGVTATVTAIRAGTATITASSGGKVDAATFIVAPVSRSLAVFATPGRIEVGKTATLFAKIADGTGNPIVDAPSPTFTTSTPNIISISGNIVTALSTGVGQIGGASGSLIGFGSVTVIAPTGSTALTVSPGTVEKLPNGTQQFTATGGSGQYTWSVNGQTGGSSTFGFITTTGAYTAPSAVPTPSTFQVCAAQASPALNGCATVTIQAIPSSGGEVIVINDINAWDNTYFSYAADQGQLYRNLMSFTANGPRASKTSFMFFRGHNSQCGAGECSANANSNMASILRAAGYTVVDVNDLNATLTTPIDPNIKAILLLVPRIPFSNQEINVLKQFAGEGGRIIFSGEHGDYYGTSIGPVQNDFFAKMGAVLRNNTSVRACTIQTMIITTPMIRPHQLTAGLNTIAIPCASDIVLGPNDYALFYDQPQTSVLGAVAKVDLTPLPLVGAVAPQSTAARVVQPARVPATTSTSGPPRP